MLEFSKTKELCSGCTACMAACPVSCIEMIADEEGFLYPEKTDACISCGRCEQVCPIYNVIPRTENEAPVVLCAVSKSHAIWKRSASGGAFSEICLAFGDENTVVVGAAWNGFRVEHRLVKGVANIAPLCKSKYIASNMANTFYEILDLVKQGTKIIFCGTPCQVAGLKKYLGRDYANILYIDLICHGVGSPMVFEECLQLMQSKLGRKIEAYQFRAKRNIFETSYLTKLSHGKKQSYFVNDPYVQLFLNQSCLRPSCNAACTFRKEQREGDLTIADFKGLHQIFPSLSGTVKNYSTIVANTTKGKQVAALLEKSMRVRYCDVEDVKKHNPLYCRHTYSSNTRDNFFKEFQSEKLQAIKAYCNLELFKKHRYWRSLLLHVPKMFYRLAKSVARKEK